MKENAPEPSTKDPLVDDYGISSVSVESLIAEMNRLGEKSFTQAHPHSYLILLEGKHETIEVYKMETRVGASVPYEEPVQGEPRRVILLTKSQRNAMVSKITIGRARNNDVVIRSPKISKLHCIIMQDEKELYHIQDMDSLNGTKINQQRLRKNEKSILRNEDKISLSSYLFQYFDEKAIVAYLKSRST